MHLEKVTTRNSEASLAGWIASNDVTLFTMALVMVIAMFLHSRVNRGERENRALTDQKTTIAATLDATARELESARELLDQTSDRLSLTQEERDKLQKQLVEKLASLAEVNAQLEALLAANGLLESERQALVAASDALSKEKAALAGDRDKLSTTNLSLRERLDLLTAQLSDKVNALAELEEQRDRLAKQADELDDIVASLKKRLEEMNIELVAARDNAEAAEVASAEQLRSLQTKAAASDKQVEDYLAQLKRAAALLDSLKADNRRLESELTEAERRRQSELLEQAENNRQLVGLRGSLRRVAILIDASGSMKQSGPNDADRWAEAQKILATWLQHLNVEECVLVVYSSRVRTFPADGTFADLRGPERQTTRQKLLDQLATVEPGGWTNTLDALSMAYQYKVDTIILFSDGAPSRDASGKYDDALAKQIYALCRQHPRTPINAIGLGNYFDAEMSTFLRTIASLTGGAFRGE